MKSDARVRYTLMVIKNSFLELLKEKPINRITVKEICEASEINRTTFYNHFDNPFDLMEQIEEEIFEYIRTLIMRKSYNDITSLYTDILYILKDNHTLYQVIGSYHGDHSFYNKIFSLCYEQNFPMLKEKYPHLNETQQNLLFYYITQGYSGAVSYWFNTGMKESPEQVADFICKITLSITQFFKEL